MPQNRREFLGITIRTGIALLAPPGVAHALARREVSAGAGAGLRPQARSFRGSAAGEERTVEGIRLRWCPAGRFTMGSPPDEVGRRGDESQVRVTLTRGFWTARTEVTQADWTRVVGDFPAQPPSTRFGLGDDLPLYWVSFVEAEEFCAKLTARAHGAGTLPRDWTFRLPTEAQWEYACRAGTRTATAFGDALRPDQANFAAGPPVRNRDDPPRGRSRAVGSYRANPWGIVDMHGNVWEWCRDWYHPRLPGGADPDLYELEGTRNRDGTHSRVRRGGAWIEAGWACRSACRLRYEPDRRSDHIGFRVVAVEVGAGGSGRNQAP